MIEMISERPDGMRLYRGKRIDQIVAAEGSCSPNSFYHPMEYFYFESLAIIYGEKSFWVDDKPCDFHQFCFYSGDIVDWLNHLCEEGDFNRLHRLIEPVIIQLWKEGKLK